MNDRMHREMLEATRLTRAGRLTDATALLQRLLRRGRAPDTNFAAADDTTDVPAGRASRVIDLEHDPTLWNHFTVVPASFDRLRSRNLKPFPSR